MDARLKNNWPVVIWIVGYLLVAKIIGDMTRDEIPLWYSSLAKPPLNPPDIAFGIVWTILYIFIAIAGWRLWRDRKSPDGKCNLALFAIQTFLNWAWSYVFFYYHLKGFAFLWIVALVLSVAALIYKSDRITKMILAPYLAWICFASYLNGMIWYLN